MRNRPTYGGQAVIEGVMIRGQRNVCVAVRRPDGTVAVRQQPLSPLFTGAARRLPLVRGVIALAETLTLGMKALNFSANVGMEAEGEEMSGAAMALMMAVSLPFVVGVFFLAPLFASEWLEELFDSALYANIAEGVIRLVFFLAYIVLIGRMNDIRRDLGQGREDEAPLMQPWMRDFQPLLLDDFFSIEEQVEVDHPGPPPLLSHAAHYLLNIQEERKKVVWADFGFERKNGVDEGRLLDGPHRLRAV